MDSCYLPIHIVWFRLYISSCFLLFTFIFCIFGVLAYISTSINDGPGCLMLRCPDPSCGAAIGQEMIDILALNEDKDKYRRYLLRSYIEDNRKVHLYLPSLLLFLRSFGTFSIEMTVLVFSFIVQTKWCPAPGCDYAVEYVVGSGSYDVSCSCSYSFCWNVSPMTVWSTY